MEDAGFQAFFEATRGPLQAYLRRVSGDEALAEDLLQESYIRFLNNPPRSDHPPARRAYLFTLAANLLRDHWRRERPWSWVPWRKEAGEDPGFPDEPACDRPLPDRMNEDRQAIHLGFQSLSPRQRSLLWLAYAEGFSHRELARVFGISEGSVKVLLHRARARMAKALAPLGMGGQP